MNTTNKNELSLNVYSRNKSGKSAAFRIRKDGKIPGVVYGPNLKSALNINIVPNEFLKVYKQAGHTTLITLKTTEGAPSELNNTKVLLSEIQVHPAKRNVEHIDFHQIDLKKPFRVVIPLSFVGKAKGTTEGGILSITTRDVEIRCLPLEIPKVIEVDVSAIGLGDSLHLSELAKTCKDKGLKFEFIYEADISLAAVVKPEEEVVAAPVVAAEGAAVPGAPGAPAAAGAAPAAGAPAAAGAKAPAAAGAKAPAAPAKK